MLGTHSVCLTRRHRRRPQCRRWLWGKHYAQGRLLLRRLRFVFALLVVDFRFLLLDLAEQLFELLAEFRTAGVERDDFALLIGEDHARNSIHAVINGERIVPELILLVLRKQNRPGDLSLGNETLQVVNATIETHADDFKALVVI